jgi:hypothetical protein
VRLHLRFVFSAGFTFTLAIKHRLVGLPMVLPHNDSRPDGIVRQVSVGLVGKTLCPRSAPLPPGTIAVRLILYSFISLAKKSVLVPNFDVSRHNFADRGFALRLGLTQASLHLFFRLRRRDQCSISPRSRQMPGAIEVKGRATRSRHCSWQCFFPLAGCLAGRELTMIRSVA